MKTIAIVGAGASGLAAAIEAKKSSGGQHTAVILYERLPRVGKKLLSTGNGRCNLSNRHLDAGCYRGDTALINAALCSRYAKTEDFFTSFGLILAEEDGRLYPKSGSAASVVDALRFTAASFGCQSVTDTPITSIQPKNHGFLLNGNIVADAVILACGGKASPDLGSDGSGYALLGSLGHTVNEPHPALVSVKCADPFFKSLKGIRIKGGVKLLYDNKTIASDAGEIQFTEYGLSGIPVFNLSRFIEPKNNCRFTISLDLCSDRSLSELEKFLYASSISGFMPTAADVLSGIMQKRLGETILKRADISPISPAYELAGTAQAVARQIKHFEIAVTDTAGFRAAQVTAGGLSSQEINPLTLESKKIPGLYICGELLDVDGICGGYNLQFAFTTGRTAGYHAMTRILKNDTHI